MLGLAYEVPGKLAITKRLGVCVSVEGETATLHVSPKEKAATLMSLSSLGSPLDLIPASLSPATRFIYATRKPSGASKAEWDNGVLLSCARDLATMSMGAMRMVADEALDLGWLDIFSWTTLSDTEKAWRRAHRAAKERNPDALDEALRSLPPAGYNQRVGLLLHNIDAVATHSSLRSLANDWSTSELPGVDSLVRLLAGDWEKAIQTGVDVLADAAPERRKPWIEALTKFQRGEPSAPMTAGSFPNWEAAATFARGRSGQKIDSDLSSISQIALPLVDDLIEAGAISATSSAPFATWPDRTYLLARLFPHELDDSSTLQVGNYAELARRYFRRRDRKSLESLPPCQSLRRLLIIKPYWTSSRANHPMKPGCAKRTSSSYSWHTGPSKPLESRRPVFCRSLLRTTLPFGHCLPNSPEAVSLLPMLKRGFQRLDWPIGAIFSGS
jgi:hypothetical protein